VDGELGGGPISRGLSSDAEMLRVSVDIARKYPRDERRVLAQLLETLDLYPQFANEALYHITYLKNKPGETTIEGLSIRAAETLASAWGHMRIGVRIIGEDDNGWDLEAVVFDMQSNNWELTPARASKWLKRRDGRMELLDDRQQLQARGSAVSKVKRNCVLSVLPLHLKAAFEQRVREKIAGGELMRPADKARVQACLDAFASDFKVTEAMVTAYIGKPRDVWVGNDLADLRGVYNALKEHPTTIKDVFDVEDIPATSTPATPPSGRVVSVEEGVLSPHPPPAPVQPPPVSPSHAPAPVIAPPPTPASPPLTPREAAERDAVEKLRRDLRASPPPPLAGPAAEVNAPVNPVNAPVHPPQAQTASVRTLEDLFAARLDAAGTIGALDELLSAMYSPNSDLYALSHASKRAAAARVYEKRGTLDPSS
jgi:hypothetical protein